LASLTKAVNLAIVLAKFAVISSSNLSCKFFINSNVFSIPIFALLSSLLVNFFFSSFSSFLFSAGAFSLSTVYCIFVPLLLSKLSR